MRTPDALRRLDEAVLPPLGRVLARLVRGARRVRFARAAAIVVSLAVVLIAVYAAGRAPTVNAGPPVPIVYMGVADGASIPAYVQDSQTKLTQLVADSAYAAHPPKLFALVSFTRYLNPTQLSPVLSGLPLQVINVFMRLPSKQQTEIIKIDAAAIPQDVIRGMEATALKKAQEVADYRTLYGKVTGDTPDDRTLRATYRLGESVSAAEQAAYSAQCGCVYAAVVYATPATLGVLAARPGVRVVEAAAPEQLLDRVVFRPPLPDQHDLAVAVGTPPLGSDGDRLPPGRTRAVRA
jgi:hypothetical protein